MDRNVTIGLAVCVFLLIMIGIVMLYPRKVTPVVVPPSVPVVTPSGQVVVPVVTPSGQVVVPIVTPSGQVVVPVVTPSGQVVVPPLVDNINVLPDETGSIVRPEGPAYYINNNDVYDELGNPGAMEYID